MLYDLHVHTNASYDGVHEPEEYVKEAKRIGLDGIAFSGHMVYSDWKIIPELKEKYKIDIFPGEELIALQNGKFAGELLGINMKKPIIEILELEDLLKELKKQKALAIVPHPFKSKFKGLGNYKIDALETLNGRRTLKRYEKKYKANMNQKAKELAEKYDFAQTGGSDAHTYFEVGTGVTDTGKLSLREAIKKKKTKTFQLKKIQWPLLLKIDIMRKRRALRNQSNNPFRRLDGS